MAMSCRAALVAVFALLALPAHADIIGKARVIDGDTLEIAGQRIRLHGIDAPESEQTCWAGATEWACGREATFALAYETGMHWVTCREKGGDGDGGAAYVCFVGNRDLGARMVGAGWALAVGGDPAAYAGEETAARAARKGLWRGEFVLPWEWRKARMR
jgi:endonuclease YncB( thermonuclease family)